MHKLLLSIFTCLVLALSTAAQSRKQEVVYLKNGSVIRNIQEMQHIDSLIRVRTTDGSLFVFGPGDLLKMNFEPKYRNFKERGYLLNVEWGLLSGRESLRSSFNNTREATSVLSVSMVNGYRFNRFLGLGLGLGIDGYRDGAMTPLFVRGTGYLLKGRFSPVYALDAGYSFYSPVFNGRTETTFQVRNRGGLMGNAAGGVQVFLGREVSFYTMLGYRMQAARYEYRSEQLQSREVENLLFRRMSLRVGFSF
jgi:hypothetical protein